MKIETKTWISGLAGIAILCLATTAQANVQKPRPPLPKGLGGKAAPAPQQASVNAQTDIYCHNGSAPPCPPTATQAAGEQGDITPASKIQPPILINRPTSEAIGAARIPASPTRLQRCGWVILEKCVTHAIQVPKGFNPQADDAVLEIATATKGDLSLVPTLTPAAITILSQEEMKEYASIAQFASKVCAKTSVDLSSVNIMIGKEIVRGTGNMRGRGFSCQAGEGSYKVDDHRLPWNGTPIKL
nr:hypothetical protein [uncultured Sphingorhabdus sp.]